MKSVPHLLQPWRGIVRALCLVWVAFWIGYFRAGAWGIDLGSLLGPFAASFPLALPVVVAAVFAGERRTPVRGIVFWLLAWALAQAWVGYEDHAFRDEATLEHLGEAYERPRWWPYGSVSLEVDPSRRFAARR